ncbi:hypothetical protein [uncultured Parolsenella sp.]|uniref:hypothetical protein n=1 Tax=uncultured Parolsenella sp. TaxID=2083008 RepID=UPI0025DE681D|nr:hypothetical protein [uncultured Parolsenella sp.]
MADNLDVFDFELAADEMARVNALPRHVYYHVADEASSWIFNEVDADAVQK